MPSKTERVVIAAAAIAIGSVSSPVGAVLGAAAVDYAAQKLAKRSQQEK
jgi:hypothetical protein